MAIWRAVLILGLLLAADGDEIGQENVSSYAKTSGCTNCPAEWTAYGRRCFKFFTQELTWTDAEIQCLTYGGNLASIHNKAENDFVQKLIKQATGDLLRTWIGGNDGTQEGAWLWSDGSLMFFHNWGPTQPNNYLGKENCLEIQYGDTQKWNDDACVARKPFVCAV